MHIADLLAFGALGDSGGPRFPERFVSIKSFPRFFRLRAKKKPPPKRSGFRVEIQALMRNGAFAIRRSPVQQQQRKRPWHQPSGHRSSAAIGTGFIF
jgi:hypothetical protein